MKLTRQASLEKQENETYIFSFASETPYERHHKEFGTYDEVLLIGEENIDWTRLNTGSCPFLKDHEAEQVLGVIQRAWIEDGKLKGEVKFSEREEVQGFVKDIEAGIMGNTSIGYQIKNYHFENVNGKKTMFVDFFEVYEASLVGIAADPTVGYNRSLETKEEDECNADDECECESDKEENESLSEDIETVETSEVDKTKEETTKEDNEPEEEKACSCEEENSPCGEDENKNNKEENKSLTRNKKMFSVRKAILNCTSKGKFDAESEEYQALEDAKRKYNIQDADIVLAPEVINEKRAIDGSEYLNQTQYRPDLYEGALRPTSTIAKTGATYAAVEGPSISFAVATSGTQGGFVGLNGSIPSANVAWEQKTLTPKKLGAYVEISYKALLQDSPSIENIIIDDIYKGVDEIKDKAMICGSGENNEPTGVYNTTGINQVSAYLSAFTLSTAFAMEKGIRDANDFSTELKWVMNSEVYYKLATKQKSATAVNEFLIEDGKMIGYDCIVDNHLPTSGLLLGDFKEVIIADFEPISVKVVEDATLSRKQAVEVQSFGACDVCVRRPKAFTKLVNP